MRKVYNREYIVTIQIQKKTENVIIIHKISSIFEGAENNKIQNGNVE